MNKGIYRAWYMIDDDSPVEYIKIVAVSRQQAKKILDLYIKRVVGGAVDCSPLPEYMGHASLWGWGEVHGDLDHERK